MVSNYAFLDNQFPVLSEFGKLAEKYLYSDSNSCLMKLGMIGCLLYTSPSPRDA